MICHIVENYPLTDAPIAAVTVRALCGAEAVVFDDGEVAPDDFDFVDCPDVHDEADCMPCLAKLAEPITCEEDEEITNPAIPQRFQWRRVAGELRRFFLGDGE